MTITDPLRPADLDDAVVATVAYSDVFDMPIDRARLRRFLIGVAADDGALDVALARLERSGRIERSGPLAHLPGRAAVLRVHADRTARATEMWADALRWGRRLGRLPFVRAVAVTGGLACESVADHDDIDYLVVTAPGRLWTARLFAVALVHLGRRRDVDLCPNYLVSTDALELDDRTAYTARELAQMVDVVGPDVLDDMRARNRWMLDHLPNASIVGDRSRVVDVGSRWATRLAEAALGLGVFDRLERWEMRRKVARLRDVASRRAEVGRPDESSFSPSVCKGHMVGNAAGIEVAWRARLVDGAPR